TGPLLHAHLFRPSLHDLHCTPRKTSGCTSVYQLHGLHGILASEGAGRAYCERRVRLRVAESRTLCLRPTTARPVSAPVSAPACAFCRGAREEYLWHRAPSKPSPIAALASS